MKDFPGDPVVGSLLPNAGDTGSIPSQGNKIPHSPGQLSLRPGTTESTRSGAHEPQLGSPCAVTTELTRSGAHVPQPKRSPHTTTKDPACHN